MIYDFIHSLEDNNADSNILDLEELDHDETIKVFEEYNKDIDKQIY